MPKSKKLKVAVCGASGYAGAELLRILLGHPGVTVTAATSEKSAGKPVSHVHGHLPEYSGLIFEPLQRESLLGRADLFFMALPHGASQGAVDYFFKKGKKVVDFSADYRLSDPLTYEKWYKVPHAFRGTLRRAVYGMPELNRAKIKRASLVANPGCYPTAAILGLYPALKAGLIKHEGIVIDAKSGVSGAGKQSSVAFSFSEVNDSMRAYAVGVHRHTPEIEQALSISAKADIKVDFTPHIVPLDRGILCTIYARLAKKTTQAQAEAVYARAAGKEPFLRLLRDGEMPDLKHLRSTNRCDIGLKVNARTGTLVIVTAIDNLVKGAAGAAVQNMNLMMGFDETEALGSPGLSP